MIQVLGELYDAHTEVEFPQAYCEPRLVALRCRPETAPLPVRADWDSSECRLERVVACFEPVFFKFGLLG